MKMIKKLDGWFNILTGLNVLGKDAKVASRVTHRPLQETEVELLYAGDDIAERIVDLVPEEAFREGWELKMGDDKETVEQVNKMLQKLRFDSKCEDAYQKARLYGTGFLFIATDRIGEDLSLPLIPGSYNKIAALVPMTKYELDPDTASIETDLRSPSFGLPKLYRFQPSSGGISAVKYVGQVIHHTRLIRIDGQTLPAQLFVNNNYSHDSVLTKTEPQIRNYSTAHDSLPTVISDFRISVLKMKNLADIVAANGAEQVKTRVEIMNYSKSVARMILIDENESFEQITANLSGVNEIVGKVDDRLVAAAKIPHTILFGESPSGLAATGRSEETTWYNYVRTQQEKKLRTPITRFLEILFASKDSPTKGTIPEFTVEFRPLWQMDEKEVVEIRKIQSEVDNSYLDRGVLEIEEVRKSRFGGDQYSVETNLEDENEIGGIAESETEAGQTPESVLSAGT